MQVAYITPRICRHHLKSSFTLLYRRIELLFEFRRQLSLLRLFQAVQPNHRNLSKALCTG